MEPQMQKQIELVNADGLTAEGETLVRWLSRYIATLPADRTQIDDMAVRAYAEQIVDGTSSPSVFFARRLQDTMQLYGLYALTVRNPTPAQAQQADAAQADAEIKAVKKELQNKSAGGARESINPATAHYPIAILQEIVEGMVALGPKGAPTGGAALLSMIEAGQDYMTALDRTDQRTVFELHRYVRANHPPQTYYEAEIERIRESK
jgi:hypothetical protein